MGVAGNAGAFTASTLDADLPALLCEGATEAPGGQLDYARDLSVSRKQGASLLRRVNRMGRYFLSVVDSGKDPSRSACDPVVSALFF